MADRIVFDERALTELFESRDGPVGRDLARRAIKVENAAKRYCPVDTGRLRSSITRELAREGDDLTARIGTNVEYARFVELGTVRNVPKPYLRPALDAARR